MCGILFHYHGESFENDDLMSEFDEMGLANRAYAHSAEIFGDLKALVPLIVDRGPNYASLRYSKDDRMSWFSSVLSLREPLTKQCIEIDGRFVLQYNGECYNSEIHHNDTQWIVDQLHIYQNAPTAIKHLSGEFAYTVYDRHTNQVFFGRDSIGKRSLSYRLDSTSGQLSIASVTGRMEGFQNCVAGVIYIYDVTSGKLSADLRIRPYNFHVAEESDLKYTKLEESIDCLFASLDTAVRRRINTIHPLHTKNSPISILFSGGLDCSVIAALVCQSIVSSCEKTVVELLNVGFENPRTGLMPENVPDRLLGQKSFQKLQALFPKIEIRFLEVDVPYEEYLEHRAQIMNLIYPKQTEMDLSIATAFYFAARGQGFVRSSTGTRERYERKGIVLFSGLGADELYGGYHKFANKSKEELVSELETQINNIHDRNLSRDDKVIAANGVEVRYPFLDDAVVEFSTQLPINYKINKMILRRLAHDKLKLTDISEEPKRAIQFGAKSAKMTKNGNKHGTDLVEA
ncbi:LANO_0B08416g1_1 [Lachancea nothofagi CBS 11611]|uniref:LANO_0B08416g1_1 n=1 Tax=Lachancea nothofagi CBS 11611 TaxID=1266666 RepID=A0A1G4J172_9SACH|nr:LANO_0B08416g1_1 [Lachancea nothofagi CBS 11611]